jgi:hypothetical protein
LKAAAKAGAIALGVAALSYKPSAAWVENAYVNGAYPGWQRLAHAVTAPLPFSLGDVAALLGVAAIVWRTIAFFRSSKRRRSWPALVLDVATICAAYAVWFEIAWGWNYERAPVETRLSYDAARVTPQAAVVLRSRAIGQMNALAKTAHERSGASLDRTALRTAWLPVVRRAGDAWDPLGGAAKPTIADPFMQATGTSGFINPLTLEVQLAGDVLWFERPFDLAHEWSHVAAYAREDEANYLAILTCLRSRDPAQRYSGWLELFLYLPQKQKYARSEFSPLVWADFAALRRRNARHVNVLLARWTWRTYGAYLKSNRIASGVANYNEVSRLMLGIPLDAAGLPVPSR